MKIALYFRCFIKLSPAFDPLNHSIIFKKLKISGKHGINYELSHFEIKNNKPYVWIDDNNKTPILLVTCEVPEGSVLGLLLLES